MNRRGRAIEGHSRVEGGTERNRMLEILEEMGSREVLCDGWGNGTIVRMEAKVTKWVKSIDYITL